jgi:hypothetical protein
LKSENIINADFGLSERPAQPTPPKKWQRIWTNYRLLKIAIIVEIVIIGAILYANFQFAQRYASDDTLAWWMAIACGVAYAAIEAARVPLAITASTHRKRGIRVVAILFMLGAVFITTKSLSQIGEQMFSHRLVDVRNAQTNLEKVQAESRGAVSDDADKRKRIEALDAEIKSLTEALKQFGAPPASRTVCNTLRLKSGGVQKVCRVVTPPWPGETMQRQLLDARAKRNEADAATTETGQNRDKAEAAIAEAQGRYDVAVMESQLHSFAAMLFMKEPSKVTDREVRIFMLIFVFVGAFAGAITATGLAYCSFTRYPPLDEPDFSPANPRVQTVEIMPALRELHRDLKLGKGR